MQITRTLQNPGLSPLKPPSLGDGELPKTSANDDSFVPSTPQEKLGQLQQQLSDLRTLRNEHFKEAAWGIGGGFGAIYALAETARQLSGATPFSSEVVTTGGWGAMAAMVAGTVAVQLIFNPLGGVIAAGRGLGTSLGIQITKHDIDKLTSES